MKSKITSFLFASLSMLNICLAQPVITGITATPFGTKTFGYIIPGAITEASAGANQTWDYSTILHDTSTYYFKNVDFTTLSPTFQATFPTANAASELYFGSTLAITQAFKYDVSDVEYLGFNSTVFSVPDTQWIFPHNFMETHAGFKYDAYGTLITPFGNFPNTIRLREVSGANFKYDFWSFSPVNKILMEYLVDSNTQVMSGQTFFDTEFPTQINELNLSQVLEIYPNPSNGMFTLMNRHSKMSAIEIYSITGETILSTSTNRQQIDLDLSDFSEGIYFVRAYVGDRIYNQKIVIQ